MSDVLRARQLAAVALVLLSLLGLGCSDGTPGAAATPTTTASANLPKDFPVYQGARLMNTLPMAQGGVSATWESDATIEGVSIFYRAALDKSPWAITAVTPSPNLQGQGIIISFQRQNDPNTHGIVSTSVFPRQPPAVGYKTVISLSYLTGGPATPSR